MPDTETAVLSKSTRRLRCALTEPEKVAKGEKLAEQVEALEVLKDEHKARRSMMTEREKRELYVLMETREDVALGSEFRDEVPVEWVAHFPEDIKKLVRTDTGEVLDVRPLEGHERQGVLPIGGVNLTSPEMMAKAQELEDDDLPAEA